MPIKLFLRELAGKKKVLVVWMIIGFILFAVFGYLQRNDVNAGIVYCSQSKLLSEAEKRIQETGENNTYIMKDSQYSYDKNAAVITSDIVLNNVQAQLEQENITLSVADMRQMMSVRATDVIELTVYGNDAALVKKICELCTMNAFEELTAMNGENTVILNHATEPFTAVVNTVDDVSKQGQQIQVFTKQAFTPITAAYITKEMIKYGILGAVLFLLIVAFLYSIRIIFREDK